MPDVLQHVSDFPKTARLSERVHRILGMNPSPFTGPGTNTYLVGMNSRFPVLIDTGIGKPEWRELLEGHLAQCGSPRVTRCLMTHAHPDHIGGPGEKDIHRVGADAGSCQYVSEGHTGPCCAPHTTRAPGAASSGPPQHAPEEASPVPCALQIRHDGAARHLLQLRQGQLEWLGDRVTLDAKSERIRIEDRRRRGVVANEKQFVRREEALEAAQASLEIGGMEDEGSRVFYPRAFIV